MSVFSICILLSSAGVTNLVYANGAKQKEVSDKLELNREEQEFKHSNIRIRFSNRRNDCKNSRYRE